jgi:ABC-2 type transport system ATP-binding protein
MGYSPRSRTSYAHLSGLEYLSMVGQLQDVPTRSTADRIDGLLRLLTLHDERHVLLSAYSKAYARRSF